MRRGEIELANLRRPVPEPDVPALRTRSEPVAVGRKGDREHRGLVGEELLHGEFRNILLPYHGLPDPHDEVVPSRGDQVAFGVESDGVDGAYVIFEGAEGRSGAFGAP